MAARRRDAVRLGAGACFDADGAVGSRPFAGRGPELFFDPVNAYLNRCLASLGAGQLGMDIFAACATLADAYLQLSVPGFEFPRRALPGQVCFVGALPPVPDAAPIPSCAADLDGRRRVVFVTQGTVANENLGQLIEPTLAALAGEEDTLVVAMLGGMPEDRLRQPLPGNARVASFLPFDWLLPKLDAVVTNGGYGTVNHALSFGIPLVTAGLSGDKGEVGVRVGWSGVGVDLKTEQPTPDALRLAVRAVLGEPAYRTRAAAHAAEFQGIDTAAAIIDTVEGVSRNRVAR